MIRSILNWTEVQATKAAEDTNAGRGLAKSFGIGALEGALDSCAMLGAVCLVCSIVNSFNPKKK